MNRSFIYIDIAYSQTGVIYERRPLHHGRGHPGSGTNGRANAMVAIRDKTTICIDESWSQLREYFKVHFYLSYIFYLKLY
jgi:hypothetical protein